MKNAPKWLLTVLGVVGLVSAGSVAWWAEFGQDKAAAPVSKTLPQNSCRAFFSAGWYLIVNENLPTVAGGEKKHYVTFRHPAFGTLEGTLAHERSQYEKLAGRAEFWGNGAYKGKPVLIRAVVTAKGGIYNQGTVTLFAHTDTNGNSAIDSSEPNLFPIPIAMSARSTVFTWAE